MEGGERPGAAFAVGQIYRYVQLGWGTASTSTSRRTGRGEIYAEAAGARHFPLLSDTSLSLLPPPPSSLPSSPSQPFQRDFSFCSCPYVYDPASKARILQLENQMAQFNELQVWDEVSWRGGTRL